MVIWKEQTKIHQHQAFFCPFWKDLEILCLEICQFEKKFNRLKSNFGNFSYDADWTTVEVDALGKNDSTIVFDPFESFLSYFRTVVFTVMRHLWFCVPLQVNISLTFASRPPIQCCYR